MMDGTAGVGRRSRGEPVSGAQDSVSAASPAADAGERDGRSALRLVILGRSLDYGGAERQFVALACGLHNRGHRVVVAVFYGGPLELDLRACGVPVEVFEKRGRWDVVGFLLRLGRFLRRERPQVVHGVLPMPNVLAVILRPLSRGRVVWAVAGADLDLARYDWLTRLVDRTERRLSRFPNLIISNSQAGRDDAVGDGFPADRTVVIPNGIDTDRFRPDPAARRRVREEFGVGEREALIGMVGRIDPQKDHPTFLRAAARLAGERGAVRFVCVGTGPTGYATELRSLADGLGLGLGPRLLWAGARADMPAVFNALDVAVLPSAYGEGVANVIGEAMACGVPCAVTDVGDSARVVADQGEVVPARDPDALAAAIGRLLDAASRGEVDPAAVRRRVVEHLSMDRFLDRTEQALRCVVGPVPPR